MQKAKLSEQELIEQIDSFEAACKFNGTDPNDPKFTSGEEDDNYKRMLKEIARALRNGVVLDFSDWNQKKWWAWRRYDPVSSGFRFYGSNFDLATAFADGAGLCTDTEKKTVHLHTHPNFQPLWDKAWPVKIV